MSNEDFERLVAEGLDSVPKEFLEKLENVAITIEDDPTPQQMRNLRLRPWVRLFGLYEGGSLIGRTQYYVTRLPDKITIFKNPILSVAETPEQVREQVRSTVMHEIAHHFGMNEQEVRNMESRKKRD